jgi:hypothetical protein
VLRYVRHPLILSLTACEGVVLEVRHECVRDRTRVAMLTTLNIWPPWRRQPTGAN